MAATLVTVATFDNPVEAANSREALDAQGIHAVLDDGELGAVAEASAVCHTKLQVPAGEASRAGEILDSLWRVRPDDPEARRAMVAALLGLAIPPLLPYSLWLLARVAPRWRDLSTHDRRRVKLAAAADLCVLVVFAAWCVLSWDL